MSSTCEVVVTSRVDHAPITLRLPFAASSVSVARQRLQAWMRENGGSKEATEDARVVISELVGNSVRHARPLSDGDILVSWTMADRTVEVSVTDGGSGTRPRKVHAPTTALAGRGMAIVQALARDWWTERTGSRSTVHARLDI
jgi:anti-sigma regulatory factor (Ser/Thr protein kinase)